MKKIYIFLSFIQSAPLKAGLEKELLGVDRMRLHKFQSSQNQSVSQ